MEDLKLSQGLYECINCNRCFSLCVILTTSLSLDYILVILNKFDMNNTLALDLWVIVWFLD